MQKKGVQKLVWMSLWLGCLLVACKHEPQLVEETRTPPLFTLKTNDSLLIVVNSNFVGKEYYLAPNIGSIRNDGVYFSPSSILRDSTMILLKLKESHETIATILLVKQDDNDTIISFQEVIMPLLVSNCNFQGCHGNGSRAGRVSLVNYDSTIKHTVPYQPTRSILYVSLIKPDPLRRMPPAGPLNGNKIAWVKKWIEQGCLYN